MPQLPILPGVTFRLFQSASDYPHFARIITACSKGEGSVRVETTEGIASGYSNLERCDASRRYASRSAWKRRRELRMEPLPT